MILTSFAPRVPGGRQGVFARNENVSSLLQASRPFLPICFHLQSQPVNLTLSQVNNGFIWAQEAAFPRNTDLEPVSPPLLQPYLTGQYHCVIPGQQSDFEYRLDVIGKKKASLNIRTDQLSSGRTPSPLI